MRAQKFCKTREELSSKLSLLQASANAKFRRYHLELSKLAKYKELEGRFVVQPVAIGTMGAPGASTDSFHRDLGRRIELASGDRRATEFLLQRVSVEVQRGNAAAVQGSLPSGATSRESDDSGDRMPNPRV